MLVFYNQLSKLYNYVIFIFKKTKYASSKIYFFIKQDNYTNNVTFNICNFLII